MLYRTAIAASLALALLPSDVFAQSNFLLCDGYGPPSSKGDGMTTTTGMLGLSRDNVDIRQEENSRFGADMLAACEAALTDPLLQSKFTVRRGHLLQAKALQQIAMGTSDQALATLAQSDAAGTGPNAALFANSVGLGNRAVRAWALIELNRKDEALVEIGRIEEARPYAASALGLVEMLKLRIDQSLDAHVAELKRQAPRRPSALLRAFLYLVGEDRAVDAAALADGLSLDRPRMRRGWSASDGDVEYRRIAIDAELSGARAWTLMIAGKPDDAAALLVEARADAEAAVAPLPKPTRGAVHSKRVLAEHAQRVRVGHEALAILAHWSTLFDLYDRAPTIDPEKMGDMVRVAADERSFVIPALVRRLKLADGEIAERDNYIRNFVRKSGERRIQENMPSLLNLRNTLPRAETRAMQPAFKGAGDGYFLGENGFSRKQMDAPGKWTIRFTHDLASAATVEELVMLSAAQYARREGFDGMILLSGRTLARQVNQLNFRREIAYSTPTGHEGQLVVQFVKRGALSAEHAGLAWRVLAADDVDTMLSAQRSAMQAGAN